MIRSLLTAAAGLLALTAAARAGPRAELGDRTRDVVRPELVPPSGPLQPWPLWTAPGRPHVAVALSGGGGRGAAHVGVLQALAEDGLELDAVAGTSMGAVVGALAAAGYSPDEIAELLRDRDWEALVSGLDLRRRALSLAEDLERSSAQLRVRWRRGERPGAGGLTAGQGLDRELRRYLLAAQLDSGGQFDRLHHRFRPVATDLRTGELRVPARGDLVALVRGSAAVPGVFAPVAHEGDLLVDGGLRQNVPVPAARTLGDGLVLAVDVSVGLVAEPELDGVADVLSRSLDIMMDHQTEDALRQADVVLRPAVEDIPKTELARHLDALLAAGRAAHAAAREAVWSAVDANSSDRRRLDNDGLEVVGTAWITAGDVEARLGASARAPTSSRVAAEVARALNLGPLAAGRAEIVERDGRHVLRFVFQETEPLREVVSEGALVPVVDPGLAVGRAFSWPVARRIAWRARRTLLDEGRLLTRLRAARFDPSRGRLTLEWTEGVVNEVEAASPDPQLDWVARRVSRLTRDRFSFRRLAWRLDDLVARGAVRAWSVVPEPADDGTLKLRVPLRPDAWDELSAGGAFRGDLTWAGFLRYQRANLTGRGDAFDVVLRGAEEVARLDVRYRAASGLGVRTLGFEVGAAAFDRDTPFVDGDQDYVERLRTTSHGGRGWAALVHRPRPGTELVAGILHEAQRIEEVPGARRAEHRRTSAFLRYDLDRQDRLLFPTRGGALRLRGERSVDGDAYWTAVVDGSWALGLGRDDRTVLLPRAGVGLTGGAISRALMLDPGGHRDVYGLVPYGALARQHARAGIALRRRLVDRAAYSVHLELAADTTWTARRRGDLFDGDDLFGYGISVTVHPVLVGPISLGWSRNDEGADVVFLVAGYPFRLD